MITDAEEARDILKNVVDVSGVLEKIEEAAKGGKNSYTTEGQLSNGKIAVLGYLGFKVDFAQESIDPALGMGNIRYVNRIIW